MDANSSLFREDRREFHLDRYKFAAKHCAGKRVLDGACGTGYGAEVLGRSAREVIGIDCDADAVQYASAHYGSESISFVKSYVELTPFGDASFDIVTSFETVEHTLCPAAHLREIVRLLKPQVGSAIISVPNSWGYTDHHFFDFNAKMFSELAEHFFVGVTYFSQNPTTHVRHPGIEPIASGDSVNAQCLIAVCEGPRKDVVVSDRLEAVITEIYRNVFVRHQEFLTLSYRQSTPFIRRGMNRLRRIFKKYR